MSSVSLLILVPFTGVLVRYRAGYYPRAPPIALTTTGDTSTPAAGTESPAAADSAPSFFEVAKRVRRLEGRAGLYKGFLPTLLISVLLSMSRSKLYVSPSPATTDSSLQGALFFNTLYAIALILTYRAIATRHKMEFFGTSVKTAMQNLFTEHERQKPWVLWLTPGLLPAFVISILLHVLVLRHLSGAVERLAWGGSPPAFVLRYAHWLRPGARILLVLLATVVLAPLDVIVTRLALQRNHGRPVGESASSPVDAEEQVVDVEKADPGAMDLQLEPEEAVVRLRGEHDLYLGLCDCAMKIVREEGFEVLYRGWLFAFLGNIYL